MLPPLDWEAESKKWVAKPAWTDVTFVLNTDDTQSAVMSLATFYGLDDYSCTLPSGTVIHKRWRRHEPYSGPGEWWMGEYAVSDNPDEVRIIWRPIFVRRVPTDEPVRATDSALNAHSKQWRLSA